MKKTASRVYLAIVFLFLYAPIFVLCAFSFNESKSRAVWTGFTFDWYKKLVNNEEILNSLKVTVAVALAAAVIATVLGTLAALGIYNMKKRTRSLVMNITYLPLLNPEIVTGVSLMLLFVAMGINFGFITLVLAHVSFCVPYVILNVMPKLRQMDRSLCDAAMDLGCSSSQVFRRVIIPEILPGIITGFLMSFTYSIDDFVISNFTYGSGDSQTLSILVYSMTRRKISPEINALSTIIFILVLSVLLVMNISDVRKHKKMGGKRI